MRYFKDTEVKTFKGTAKINFLSTALNEKQMTNVSAVHLVLVV